MFTKHPEHIRPAKLIVYERAVISRHVITTVNYATTLHKLQVGKSTLHIVEAREPAWHEAVAKVDALLCVPDTGEL